MKKSLTEYGDKLDAGEKDKIEAAIKEVEEVLKGDDKDAIEAKPSAGKPRRSWREKMYAQQAAPKAVHRRMPVRQGEEDGG